MPSETTIDEAATRLHAVLKTAPWYTMVGIGHDKLFVYASSVRKAEQAVGSQWMGFDVEYRKMRKPKLN